MDKTFPVSPDSLTLIKSPILNFSFSKISSSISTKLSSTLSISIFKWFHFSLSVDNSLHKL